MNKLFPVITLALLCALGLSLTTSWYLQEYPLFKADLTRLEAALESAADEARLLLNDAPEEQWDDLLLKTTLDESFEIDWYSVDEIYIPIEEQALLQQKSRLITLDIDDTPTAELLFSQQKMVVVITPLEHNHQFLNTASIVLAVLAICFSVAMLVFIPIAKRLKKLRSLARHYAEGNWQIKNTDKSHDEIGRLGESMEDMANRIQHLVENNNTLVQDQRDLMQAVAHEFRAPMARMRFALEMQDSGIVNAESALEISNALDELNDMVSEVLHYSRMQISAPALVYSVVPLHQLINECVNKCRTLYPDTNIDIAPDLPDIIAADPTHLQRALINLISNAAKYGDTTVAISACSSQQSITIHIDDDGDGIDSEHRERALKPFVRLDSSRTRKLGGTGLGLAIAHSVATKHGGTLEINDSPAGGARLTMTLPVKSQ